MDDEVKVYSAILIQSFHTKLHKKEGYWKRCSLAFQKMAERREHHPWRQDWIQFLRDHLSPVFWSCHAQGDEDRGLFIKKRREAGFPPYWNGFGYMVTQTRVTNLGSDSQLPWTARMNVGFFSFDSSSLESNCPSMFCNSVMNWSPNFPCVKVSVSISLVCKAHLFYCHLAFASYCKHPISLKVLGKGGWCNMGLIQYLLYLRQEACKQMIY